MFGQRTHNPLQRRLGSTAGSWTECHASTLTIECLEERSMLSAVALGEISISENTGEKPQSKVWEHAGQWWTALSADNGTWISRLDGTDWTQVLKVSSSSGVHTDVLAQGDLTHILLFDGSSSRFATVEYSEDTNSYTPWSTQPNLIDMNLPGGIETATIDIDSQGRMWVAYDQSNSIEVRYSDGSYTNWSGPITLATGISSDDISVIMALPNNKIGVLWSNQSDDQFGFRVHEDGADPTVWSATEMAAPQSAASNMADDHLNVAVGSDGTLYVAAKTSFDSGGRPKIVLLVRQPSGTWDEMYAVDTSGTRPIVLVNESANKLIVAYTSSDSGGNILYKESSLDNISFGSRKTMISSSSLNNVTSTKQNFSDEVVLLASSGGDARGVLFNFDPIVVNAPPLVDAGTNRSLTVGSSLNLQGTASDDGLPGPLTTSWSVVSGPGTVDFGNASALSTTAQFSVAGEYVLRLTANDGQLTAIDQLVVTVNSASPLPPTTTTTTSTTSFQQGVNGYYGIRDTTIRRNSAGSNFGNDSALEFDGSPDEAALLAWDLSSIAPGSVVTNVRLEFTVTNNSSDTYELYALQRAWDEAAATWQRATSGQNWGSAGAASASDHGSAVVGQFARDANGAYQLELNAAGVAMVQGWINNPATNHGFVIQDYDNASDGAHIVSSEGANASQRPKLVVTYQQTTESTQSTEVTGPTENQPPVVDAGTNQSLTFGTVATLQGSATDDDLPSPLSTTWSVVSGPGTVSFGNGSALNTTAQFSTAGSYVLRLTATDGELSVSDQVTVTLTNGNTPPVVEAGANQLLTLGSSLALLGTASDDGLPGPVSTTWSVVSGPGSVNFANATALSTNVEFSMAGSYVLRLTATDGALSASDQLTVTVNAPAPPPTNTSTPAAPVTVSYQQGVDGYQGTRDTTIRSGSANSNFGNAQELEFDGSPDESTLLAWDLSSIAAGSIVTDVSLEFQVTNNSSHAYEIYALNKAWNENTATWQQASNGLSWASAGAAGGNDRGTTVLGRFARDANGAYELQLNSAGIAVVQGWIDDPTTNHGIIIQDYDNASDGAHIVSSEGARATQRPKIVVTYQPVVGSPPMDPGPGEEEVVNTPPVVEAGANQSLTLGSAITLQGMASDDGLPDSLSTTWSVISGSGTVSFENASDLNTTAQFNSAGSYVLQLTATDGELVSSDQLTVTVNAPTPPVNTNQPVTISFQQGVGGYAGTRDTTIRTGAKNTNFGNANELEFDGSPDEAALLAWDLSSIPTGSVVTGVSLELTVTNNSSDAYEIYAVDRAWDEFGATWNQAANGDNWGSAGASSASDHGSTVLGQFNLDRNGLYELALNDYALSVVQTWIDNPLSNHGFIFQDYNNASDGAHVVSSEGSSVTQRPKIIVTYEPGEAL